jgi:hypothetical protein
LYQDFPAHIMRIDFARFCILHYYGGIYADMDVYCYKVFYFNLNQNCVYLLPAPYGKTSTNGENLIENALMISPQKHLFFSMCMKNSKEVFYDSVKKQKITFPLSHFGQLLICNTTGPVLVSKTFSKFNKDVKILDALLYNNHGLAYHETFNTKHLLTGCWGKEVLNSICFDSYLQECKKYCDMKDVTINNFDFYHDYTNGGYLRSVQLDIHQNMVDKINDNYFMDYI